MSIGTVILILLVLLLVGAFPAWPHSASWGNGPVSVLAIVLIVVVVLLVTGKL